MNLEKNLLKKRIDQIILTKGWNYSKLDTKKISKELNIEEHEIKELLTEMQSEMYYASIIRKLDGQYSGIY
jgi:hypothetical protein